MNFSKLISTQCVGHICDNVLGNRSHLKIEFFASSIWLHFTLHTLKVLFELQKSKPYDTDFFPDWNLFTVNSSTSTNNITKGIIVQIHGLSLAPQRERILKVISFSYYPDFYIILVTPYKKFFKVCGIWKVLTWFEYTLLMDNQETMLMWLAFLCQFLTVLSRCHWLHPWVYICHSWLCELLI